MSDISRRPGAGLGVHVRQEKTDKRLWIPLHRDLLAVHAEMLRRSTHLLTSSAGTPWTGDGFRASWKAEMKRRIFRPFRRRGLVFHGLRASQLWFSCSRPVARPKRRRSITGQSLQMIEHYSKDVNQPKMATAAILKLEAGHS